MNTSTVSSSSTFCGPSCPCGAFFSLRAASGDQVAPPPPCRLPKGDGMAPISLCHTLNSRGELGTFVNPYACSCVTCTNYVAERAPLDREDPPSLPAPPRVPLERQTAIGVSTLFGGAGCGCGGDVSLSPPVRLQRAPANHVWDGEGWVHQDSLAGQAILNPEETTTMSSLPGVSIARSATTVSSFPSVALARTATSMPSFSTVAAPDEDEVMDQLRSLRSILQLRQDEVYHGCRSYDEMAAADEEFEELDRKIDAIEQCMSVFGAIFRTR